MAQFSIVIPVYNVAPYLRGCLDSVVVAVGNAKTTAEVICVDDGSTDDTGTILDEYATVNGSDNLAFHVIHQQNAGVSAARNAALDKATGEWVIMLDGDDKLSPDLLARLCEIIRLHPDCDAIGFGMVRVNERGETLSRFGCDVAPEVTTGDDILLDGRGPKSHFIWSSSDKIYRRSVIERYRIRYVNGIRVGEDSLFVQEFFARCGKVVLDASIVGYRYLIRQSSSIHSSETDVPKELFPKFLKLLSLWKEIKTRGLKRRLQIEAAEAPFIYAESRFANKLADKILDATLDSGTFNKVVIPFAIFHGSMKTRLFAMAYLILPRSINRRLITFLRG